jgi:hypothetical protein
MEMDLEIIHLDLKRILVTIELEPLLWIDLAVPMQMGMDTVIQMLIGQHILKDLLMLSMINLLNGPIRMVMVLATIMTTEHGAQIPVQQQQAVLQSIDGAVPMVMEMEQATLKFKPDGYLILLV